jgi:hypothetical protein
MNLRRLSLVSPILVVIGASSAIAADGAAPPPAEAPAHPAKPTTRTATPISGVTKPSKPAVVAGRHKAPTKPAAKTDNFKYSDPTAPNNVAPVAKGALANPNDGLSFDLKWHASSDPINPYEAVQHTAGPNGPGDGVEAGVKIPFFGF